MASTVLTKIPSFYGAVFGLQSLHLGGVIPEASRPAALSRVANSRSVL